MNSQDTSRLMAAAKARAIELRREAAREFWDAVFAYAASLMTSRRAPRSRSTSPAASAGKASPRHATC